LQGNLQKEGSRFATWSFSKWGAYTLFTVGTIPILTAFFGTISIGENIFDAKKADLDKIYEFSKDWLDFNINEEIPILYHNKSFPDESFFLLTNLNFHYRLPKSKKLKDGLTFSLGKIPISDIEKFELKTQGITRTKVLITINGNDLGVYIGGDAASVGVRNLHNLFQRIIMKKKTFV
jgi:hypothetical protein